MNLAKRWTAKAIVSLVFTFAHPTWAIEPVNSSASGDVAYNSTVCQKQKVLQADTCEGDGLEPEEIKLYELINQYRAQHNLPAIPLSKSLTLVANRHVHDLQGNMGSLTHSWSNCAFSAHDASTYPCMWSAPQRLKTKYPGYGFENAYTVYQGNATAEKALNGWQKHTSHNEVMINLGKWKKKHWNAIGIALYKGYAVIWFGEESDPAGVPTKASTN